MLHRHIVVLNSSSLVHREALNSLKPEQDFLGYRESQTLVRRSLMAALGSSIPGNCYLPSIVPGEGRVAWLLSR